MEPTQTTPVREEPHESTSSLGFTLVEVAFVLLIVGVLLAITLPVNLRAQELAENKACFANQRAIEGAVQTYLAESGAIGVTLQGVVDASHPLIASGALGRIPRCPAAPAPGESGAIDAAHGAYRMNANGAVMPCTFNHHGHY